MEILKFEWDPEKNEINKQKHGMSFEAARQVFYDDFAIMFDDPEHSDEEDRFLVIGTIDSGKICIVSHCYRDRGSDNVIRIISARKATNKERGFYMKGW